MGTQQDSSGEVSFVYRVRIPHPPLTLPPSQLIMTSELDPRLKVVC